jgi:putative ABC transport system substrate-binding protein
LILLLWPPATAMAQETGPARIGFVRSSPPPAQNLEAFRQGMRDRGHVEGKTYVIVPGWGRKYAATTRRLVDEGVKLIVTVGSRAAGAVNRAAPSMPIVMASAAAPVRTGRVKSLAAPGGNITGMSAAAVDASVKRLEILKQLVPGLRRVAAIHRKRRSGRRASKTWTVADEHTSGILGIEIQKYFVGETEEFDALMRRMSDAGVKGIDVRSTPSFTAAQHRALVQAALRAKLPTIYTTKRMVKLGGLLSLGTSRPWLFRRAAAYVALILKGAKPADLPVERPRKFDLVINLKTAKALGITIPVALLLRADEVIE